MSAYTEYLHRAKHRHGEQFDDSELYVKFVPYFHGARIRVSSPGGHVRTGIVSVTTGWRPAFMLMHRSNASGSWDLLREDDEIIAVQVNGRYRPVVGQGVLA